MANVAPSRVFTLLQREMQEYKGSLFWTPIVIAIALTLLMTVSVILANRISALGDTMLQVLLQEESVSGMSITINIDDDEERIVIDQMLPPDAPDAPAPEFRIEPETEQVTEEDWNFSREWSFRPKRGGGDDKVESEAIDSLNPALTVLHFIFLLVLFVVTVNYLLGSLFNDRKDRSILFWKSMPVSEWEEVLAKLCVALFVAPLVYIAVSLVTQVVYMLLAMVLVTRMGLDPMEVVVANIDFAPLLLGPISGWLLSALFIVPAYAWLMLASAGARRSPFMLAIAPVIGIVVLEELFLGTDYVDRAISNHVPHMVDGHSTVGFILGLPDLGEVNYLSMVLGLVFAALALWGAVYLRRYRFEI